MIEQPMTAGMVEGDVGTRYRLRAFGLLIEADWPLPGSRPLEAAAGAAAGLTRVQAVSSDELDDAWGQPSELVFRPEFPGGRTRIEIRRSESHYLIWYDVYGRYTVTLDGSVVTCEAGGVLRMYQERLLFAQALPLAAVLKGIELLHGSAVVAGDGVAAFVGPSGVGKTTLASRLVLRGATLVTDDVVALEPTEDGMLAHPGAPMMVVLPEDVSAPDGVGRLGPPVGRSDKIHVSVPTQASALPLKALYYLERADAFAITRLEHPDVRRLLGTGFVHYLATPERLRHHLEIAQLLSARVAQFRLELPSTSSLDVVLDSLQAHLEEAIG